MDLIQLNRLSEELLLKVKMQKPTKELVDELRDAPSSFLGSQLVTDRSKKAFWINTYNAFYQIMRMSDGVAKTRIYKERVIEIAGSSFSLDDIEHGILRRYRWKPSMGYLTDPFVRKELKELAVENIDFRIHFALNCGAKSCPPIAFYDPEGIDQQLDLATLSFLEMETEIIEDKKEILVTRLMLWYIGDFGGQRGVRKVLQKVLGIDTHGYKLKFKPYSWVDALENFTEME